MLRDVVLTWVMWRILASARLGLLSDDAPTNFFPEIAGMPATQFATGVAAEHIACMALVRDGFNIVGRRLRTPAGEIDAVAERNGLTVFVEVKARRDLASAAGALQPRQQARLMNAAEILLAENPNWGQGDIRFDVMAVDRSGRVRRIADAFRLN